MAVKINRITSASHFISSLVFWRYLLRSVLIQPVPFKKDFKQFKFQGFWNGFVVVISVTLWYQPYNSSTHINMKHKDDPSGFHYLYSRVHTLILRNLLYLAFWACIPILLFRQIKTALYPNSTLDVKYEIFLRIDLCNFKFIRIFLIPNSITSGLKPQKYRILGNS